MKFSDPLRFLLLLGTLVSTALAQIEVTSGGNVGIGTSSPLGTLDINGPTVAHNGERRHSIAGLTGPNNSSDSHRYEIARMGVNQVHWGNFGIATIELFQTYPGAGAYQKWYVKAGYGDFSGSATLMEKYGSSQSARVALGAPVLTGNSFSGSANQYIPIYVDAGYYSAWTVTITHHWNTTDNAVPEYSQFRFFASPSQTTLSGQSVTAPETHPTIDGTLVVNGNVGVGTGGFYYGTGVRSITLSAPTYPAYVWQVGETPVAAMTAWSGGNVRLSTIGSGSISFELNDTDRVVFATSGNVGIGTTSPSSLLHVNGAVLASAYNTTSDARLKTNIRPLTNSGAVIDALQPRVFDWKSGENNAVGFIAQELYEAAPYAVTAGDDDPDEITYQWAVDASKLVPVLTAEVKALRARAAEQELTVQSLRARTAEQEKTVGELAKQLAEFTRKIAILENR